jgi:hypothetical protein
MIFILLAITTVISIAVMALILMAYENKQEEILSITTIK